MQQGESRNIFVCFRVLIKLYLHHTGIYKCAMALCLGRKYTCLNQKYFATKNC